MELSYKEGPLYLLRGVPRMRSVSFIKAFIVSFLLFLIKGYISFDSISGVVFSLSIICIIILILIFIYFIIKITNKIDRYIPLPMRIGFLQIESQ